MVGKIAELSEEAITEMAMIDLAYMILEESKEPIYYQDLISQVMALKQVPKKEFNQQLARVYTEMNIDTRFACVGDNAWALRKWYPVDALVDAASTGVSFDDDEFEGFEEEEEFEEDDELERDNDEEKEEDDLDEELDKELDEDLDEEADDDELLDDEELPFDDDEELIDEEEDFDEEDEED